LAIGGDTVKDVDDGYNVPKTHLASLIKGLQARKILKIAAGLKEADALRRELDNYMIKKTAAGQATLEAGTGHDDLVAALSLACFIAQEAGIAPLILPIELKRRWSERSTGTWRRVSRGSYNMSSSSYF
jgi:hypothetical protein